MNNKIIIIKNEQNQQMFDDALPLIDKKIDLFENIIQKTIIYVQKNNQLIGWIDVEDEIRPDAKLVIETLHQQGVHTILLSGDRQSKCDKIGKALGIQEIIGEQSPADKLTQLDNFVKKYPTAMVGDGINDAPALAKATIGISLKVYID